MLRAAAAAAARRSALTRAAPPRRPRPRPQSVGQMIGEVLKQMDEERFIVKVSSGPRYVVGVRKKVSATGGGARAAAAPLRLPRPPRPHTRGYCAATPGAVSARAH